MKASTDESIHPGIHGSWARLRSEAPSRAYDTGQSWPVLTAEVTPRIDTALGRSPSKARRAPTTWTWDEIHALPQSTYDGAFHCVRRGRSSTCDGAGFRSTCCSRSPPAPSATHVVAFSSTGYTTNLSLADVTGGKAWVAFEADGAPLSATTADRRGCSCPTSTSGRARSRSPASPCWITTSPGSGRCAATTIAATRRSSSATKATVRERPVDSSSHRSDHGKTSWFLPSETETPRTKSFTLALSHPAPHLAGQHFVVRLTAPDGYTAHARTPSHPPRATAPTIELTVERLPEGEVSSFLHDELPVGDTARSTRSHRRVVRVGRIDAALLIGGGTGVVPLMAMLLLPRRGREPGLT